MNLDEDMLESDCGQYDDAMATHARRNPVYAASGRDRTCPRCGNPGQRAGCCTGASCTPALRKNPAPAASYRLQNKTVVLAVLAHAQILGPGKAAYVKKMYPALPDRVVQALLDRRYTVSGNDLVVQG